MKKLLLAVAVTSMVVGCGRNYESQTTKDAAVVEAQQGQIAKSQPIPVFDWSLERDLLIQLYHIRNQKAVTHSVWRSITGMVEDDCPSIGFGIPYDTSLTNPWTHKLFAKKVRSGVSEGSGWSTSWGTVEQPEPNGIFASKNSDGTWVMCSDGKGGIDPIQVETKVTTYPYPVEVNYTTNRVTKSGESSVKLNLQ